MLTLCKPWVDECNGLAIAWMNQCEIAGRQIEARELWERYTEGL